MRAANDGCTHAQSCPCPTNLYQCGTLRATLYSCEYTQDCDTVKDCETLDCEFTDFHTCEG